MTGTSWTLSSSVLSETLVKPSEYSSKGLLLEPREFAGAILFEKDNCRIIDDRMVCDKVYKNHTIVKGNKDSVSAPNALVNFHTHPLKCYIDGNVLWGWPSGEDMAQCIRFAMGGNMCHIIFSIEGTYIIHVNRKLKTLDAETIDAIEEAFKRTHKYRWYKNMESSTPLYSEFASIVNSCGIKCSSTNTLDIWLSLVNNFKLKHLNNTKFGTNSNSTEHKKIFSGNIFKVHFVKNKTIQDPTKPDYSFKLLQNIKTTNDMIKCVKMPTSITFKL